MAHLELVTLVVRDYDPAIAFFVGVLGFDLVEDIPSITNDGRPKRWVVVRPRGGGTGMLLARADGAAQAGVVGNQFGGRFALSRAGRPVALPPRRNVPPAGPARPDRPA